MHQTIIGDYLTFIRTLAPTWRTNMDWRTNLLRLEYQTSLQFFCLSHSEENEKNVRF